LLRVLDEARGREAGQGAFSAFSFAAVWVTTGASGSSASAKVSVVSTAGAFSNRLSIWAVLGAFPDQVGPGVRAVTRKSGETAVAPGALTIS
jgi:hypothetical protein